MKTITIVIPTMKRNKTDFEYLSECIQNSDFSVSTDIYIYM